MGPLRFTNPSPPSGWVKDFHLQAVGHARHYWARRLRRLCPPYFTDYLADPNAAATSSDGMTARSR